MTSGVPILMYHRLFAGEAELAGQPKGMTRHWVAVEEFARQVRALDGLGYRAVPLSALLPGAAPIEAEKPIVVTFDDGAASDVRHARPILARAGWCSEHFVTVDWIGTDGFLSWADAAELAAAGAGVHSHTLTHRDLDRLSPPEIRHELEASKARLEERLGLRVDSLALPGGTGANGVVSDIAGEEAVIHEDRNA